MTFQLHPQLSKDCIEIGKFDLCRLLLMNDSQFPWFILVPEVAEITEIYQLTAEQRKLLIEESSFFGQDLTCHLQRRQDQHRRYRQPRPAVACASYCALPQR